MPQANNELDLTTVGDVVLHLYYTALDGGAPLKQASMQDLANNAPNAGVKWFSALNDFPASAATVANPYPQAPWPSFVATPTGGGDQLLTLPLAPAKFPPWTRGKTIAVTGLTVLTIDWAPGNFVLEPQAPLPNADVALTPVPGATEPNICAGNVAVPPGTGIGTWSFKLRKQAAADFHSLGKNDLGDVVLLISYTAA